ncbi:MAG: TlpA disulfide reductase family protein [Bacteroidales bacterium]|jgi:peroxiredoxin|nr:TlpA disulfide reductase family protein [Bacteroidales bacterium]
MKQTYITLFLLAFSFLLSAQDYPQVGDKVEDLTMINIDGDTVTMASLEGKLVYINFFAIWCGPCLKELAHMEEEILKGKDKDEFYFITLGRGHSTKELQAFKSKKGFNFNIGLDTDKSLFYRFSEKGIPLNIIIDQEGKIIYKETGYSSTSLKKIKKTIKRNL